MTRDAVRAAFHARPFVPFTIQVADGRSFDHRGKTVESELAPWCMATVHPSSLLRAPDEASRRAAYQEFVRDLKVLARHYRTPATASAPRH